MPSTPSSKSCHYIYVCLSLWESHATNRHHPFFSLALGLSSSPLSPSPAVAMFSSLLVQGSPLSPSQAATLGHSCLCCPFP